MVLLWCLSQLEVKLLHAEWVHTGASDPSTVEHNVLFLPEAKTVVT